MKVSPMNARIVVSSSEVVLRELLEGQPSDLVEDLTRDLRIKQTIRWPGPEASRAPFVVRRRDPEGGETTEATRNLIASGKIHWDPNALAFVAQPDDPAEYTIPGDDEDLSEVLDHPAVPKIVRDRLREYQARTAPSPGAIKRVLTAIRNQLDAARPRQNSRSPFVLRTENRLAAKEGAVTIRDLRTDDGHEIRVSHRRGDDRCSIELRSPLPEGLAPSEFVLKLGGRTIGFVVRLNKFRYGRIRYGDVEDILEPKR